MANSYVWPVALAHTALRPEPSHAGIRGLHYIRKAQFEHRFPGDRFRRLLQKA